MLEITTTPRMQFSENARELLQSSAWEAGELTSNALGTEYILFGLINDPEIKGILTKDGVDLNKIRETIIILLGQEVKIPEQVENPKFTSRAKKVIELAMDQAITNGVYVITPLHLLIGIVREGGGTAALILKETYARKDLLAHFTALEEKERTKPRAGKTTFLASSSSQANFPA